MIPETQKGNSEWIRDWFFPIVSLIKWILLAVLIGGIVGIIGSIFAHVLSGATKIRGQLPFLFYLLPVSGIIIVFLYDKWGKKDKGTNQVLSAVKMEDEVPFATAPLIFIGTALTHLTGGSAGREGAALQLGGSIANQLARWLRLDKEDTSVLVMCGMSAAFAALFGTPLAAAVFSLEVVNVGMIYYSGLLPCMLSALTAAKISGALGVHAEAFAVSGITDLTISTAAKTGVLTFLCVIAGILFCMILNSVGDFYGKWLKNKYLRIIAASLGIMIITLFLGTTDYMGSGAELIIGAVEESAARPLDFFWKILLTALTMKAGFKGGEIVPSLCIGATLGCVLGQMMNFSPSVAAACGMVAVFCTVTNCPLSALLIAFELFGFEGVSFYLIAVAISFGASGYYSLYKVQTFHFGKEKAKVIKRKAKV